MAPIIVQTSILGRFFGVDFLSQSRLPGPVSNSDWLSPPRLRILCCWRSWLRFYSWATMVGFFSWLFSSWFLTLLFCISSSSLKCDSQFPLQPLWLWIQFSTWVISDGFCKVTLTPRSSNRETGTFLLPRKIHWNKALERDIFNHLPVISRARE